MSILTDKRISQVAHAPNYNEWRAYLSQTKPHWEDISWRVKEPNVRGEAEVHLGFYSARPSEELAHAIDKAEELAKGRVSHVIKNENGIRLVWKVDLNYENAIDNVFIQLNSMLSSFLDIAFDVLIKSTPLSETSIANKIVLRFGMSKGEGDYPDGGEFSSEEVIDIRKSATFYLDYWNSEDNLSDVKIEQCKILYDGITHSEEMECGLHLKDSELKGYPSPIVEFTLSRPVDVDDFRQSIWMSRYAINPFSRLENLQDPFFSKIKMVTQL